MRARRFSSVASHLLLTYPTDQSRANTTFPLLIDAQKGDLHQEGGSTGLLAIDEEQSGQSVGEVKNSEEAA